MGSLLGDLQLLCHSMARQCTLGIALVWMGEQNKSSQIALEQEETQCWAVH